MNFGLCSAPETFERCCLGLPTTVFLFYLDDILVPVRTFSQQNENLRAVFQRLKAARLKLNPKKAESALLSDTVNLCEWL